MVKVSNVVKRILIIFIMLILPPIFIFGASGGVYAAAETEEQENSGIMRELSGLTIDGKKFNAASYPALGFGSPGVLCLNEVGYNYYANKQDNYQLTLYIYNPAQLALKEDVRNTVQMKAGADADYYKYSIKLMDASADKLFYKFKINFTAAQKSAVLSNLDKESRRYEISSLEFYIEGYNAKSFAIGRTYTFTGYGSGMDDKGSASPTLASTLSYTVAGGMDPIPVEVHHTSWRPEGTNGNSEYTQDTIHSVYFAVKNEYAKQYDYLNSVKAEWQEARLAPVYVSKNKEVLSALDSLLESNSQYEAPKEFVYPNFKWHLVSPDKATYLEWFADGHEYELFFGNDKWFKYLDESDTSIGKQDGNVINRLKKLFLYGLGDSDSVLSSTELVELVQKEAQYGHFNNDCEVAGKYPSYLFESWDKEKGTRIITLGKGEEITDPNVTVVTSKDLDLKSEELEKNFWQQIFGGQSSKNKQIFKDIKAIQEVTDSLVYSGTPKTVCNRLYISERDYDDFIDFYKTWSKKDCTIYLMRYAVSEYKSVKVGEWEDVGAGIAKQRSEGYFAQETCYLDFDIIRFEYKKKDVSYIIPVSMSPIDIFDEFTPPVDTKKTNSDFWIYGLIIIAALIVIGIVWAKVSPLMNASKKLRGVKPMVASFIILAIIAVLRIMAETLMWKFAWLTQVIPYLNYACIGGAALFALFALGTLIRKLLFGKA